jgi:hypothetical protein
VAEQTVEMINPMLGLEPFVLVEFRQGDDGEMRLALRYGGGVDSAEDAGSTLWLALTQLPDWGGPLIRVLAALEDENQPDDSLPLGEMNVREGVRHAVIHIREAFGLE